MNPVGKWLWGLVLVFINVGALGAATFGDLNADTWAAHGKQPPTGPILRHYEPMVIGAEELKPLWGKLLAEQRLFAWRDGKWNCIPYQFDDRTPDNHLVFTSGSQANPQDGNLRLDAKDEVMFMIRDAGEAALRSTWPEGVKEGVEIKLEDPVAHKAAYVYLFHFQQHPPQVEWPQLLVADDSGPCYQGGSNLWQVRGIVNRHQNRVYKTILNDALWIPKVAGGTGQNILDTMKYRAEVRFLFGMLKIRLNERNFIGEVTQYRIGPVRLAVRNWAQIVLPGQLKSPKLWAEMSLFETFVVVPIKIRVPFNPNVVITDFRMSMGYDLNEAARGMKFYNSNNLQGFVVDGVTQPEEKNMNTDIDDWRLVTGPQGTILTYSVWDEGYRGQAKIKVFFVDDLKTQVPPEKHLGQLGYFFNESTISSLEARDYDLSFYICFPPHFYDPKGLRKDILTEYLNMKQKPVYAVINGKKIINRIAQPEPFWPKFN